MLLANSSRSLRAHDYSFQRIAHLVQIQTHRLPAGFRHEYRSGSPTRPRRSAACAAPRVVTRRCESGSIRWVEPSTPSRQPGDRMNGFLSGRTTPSRRVADSARIPIGAAAPALLTAFGFLGRRADRPETAQEGLWYAMRP